MLKTILPLLLVILSGCSEEKLEEKVEERVTNVLVVSNQTFPYGRYNEIITKVSLYLPTQVDNIVIIGEPHCLKTHELKVGETYKIMLKYNTSGKIAVTPSLCTLTALIKKQNGGLNNETK